jgi:FkbM family methyltransferase
MNIKHSVVRALFPLAKAIVNYVPSSRKIAWNIYTLTTLHAERWAKVHGLPLLTNVHDNGIGTSLFFQDRYAQARVSQIQEVVKEGDVVIDIGANIGYFTILLAKLVGPEGRVYAFEPDPRSFRLLRRTIKKNGWSHVIAEQKAVSNKAGEILLYQTPSWTSNALVPGRENISTVRVPVITLDDTICEPVDFIKMDTDGSEPLIIQGAKKLISQSPNLKMLVEYEPENLKRYLNNPLDIIDIAKQHGLKLTAILDSDNGRLPNLDLAPLRRLSDNANLDLFFITST